MLCDKKILVLAVYLYGVISLEFLSIPTQLLNQCPPYSTFETHALVLHAPFLPASLTDDCK